MDAVVTASCVDVCQCDRVPSIRVPISSQVGRWPRKPGHFHFFEFLVPDWDPGPVQMKWDRRDIAGRALKAGFGRVFVKRIDFSSKFRSPSATYPFFGILIHEYLFMNTSTRFIVCFSFRTRSPNL